MKFLLFDETFNRRKFLTDEFINRRKNLTDELLTIFKNLMRVLITGILSILKPEIMTTKGYSFQDNEKTIIIDTDINMDIVVEKEKNE